MATGHPIKTTLTGDELLQLVVEPGGNKLVKLGDISLNAETHNATLYVDKNGDDSTAIIGDSHNAWFSPLTARTSSTTEDNIILHAGVWDWNSDLSQAVITDSTIKNVSQIAQDNKIVNLTLAKGTKLTATQMWAAFGGGGTSDILTNSQLHIVGNGDIEYNGNLSIDVALGFYGDQNSKYSFELDNLTLNTLAWGSQISCGEFNGKIKNVQTNTGQVTDFTSYTSNLTSCYSLEIDSINSNMTSGIFTRLFRYQMSDWLSGTKVNTTIDNINMQGDRGNCFYFQSNNGGSGGNFNFEVNNLSNSSTVFLAIPDITSDSNIQAEINIIQLSVNNPSTSVDNLINVKFNNIKTTIPIIGINEFKAHNSRASIQVNNGISTNNVALVIENLNEINGSTIEIHDSYLESRTANVGILGAVHASATNISDGRVVFKNCRFKSANGFSVFDIHESYDQLKLQFENCTFINDGTVAAITSSTATAPFNINFINCFTNSTATDANVVDVLGGLTMDTNVI